MSVSVADIMRQINNYFEVGCISGVITISGNAIVPQPDSPYVCVKGSFVHDGVYKVIGPGLLDIQGQNADEEFDGRVWELSPPPDFLRLCEEIAAYDEKNPAGALQQERFGDYSYSRHYTESSYRWEDVFASRLRPYRRMYTEVV